MLGLFSAKTSTSPAQMFETLGKLQTKREELSVQLAKTDAEIEALKASLNQLLGGAPAQTNAPAQHNQTPATTQALQVHRGAPPAQHAPWQAAQVPTNVEHNRTTMAQATTPPNTISASSPKTAATPTGIQSRLAPTSAAAGSTTAGMTGMASIINDRAPYHTEELQITGVQPQGQIVMYKHYLAGDGINSGIPALEGCVVTIKQSASGNAYRQMETPALKITCTLARPLPTSFVEQKRAIRKWLAANEYLTTSDPAKTAFTCEYDAYGNLYTPYVSVDTKGLNLFIYIGCASMTSAKPCPTLIA